MAKKNLAVNSSLNRDIKWPENAIFLCHSENVSNQHLYESTTKYIFAESIQKCAMHEYENNCLYTF